MRLGREDMTLGVVIFLIQMVILVGIIKEIFFLS
jgi:hypothetical protein